MTNMSSSPRLRSTLHLGLIIALLAVALQAVQGADPMNQVSEVQCRPYIEKALKDHQAGPVEGRGQEDQDEAGGEDTSTVVSIEWENKGQIDDNIDATNGDGDPTMEIVEIADEKEEFSENTNNGSSENNNASVDNTTLRTTEDLQDYTEPEPSDETDFKEAPEEQVDDVLNERSEEQWTKSMESDSDMEKGDSEEQSMEDPIEAKYEGKATSQEATKAAELLEEFVEGANEAKEQEVEIQHERHSAVLNEVTEEIDNTADAMETDETQVQVNTEKAENEENGSTGRTAESLEIGEVQRENASIDDKSSEAEERIEWGCEEVAESKENAEERQFQDTDKENEDQGDTTVTTPEEELSETVEIPENLRPKDHISQILRLDLDNELKEATIHKASDMILKELKRLYDTAIKPLESLYKYRDLSNRHFGDPEIFSKPLVLFMGPWSGGKSSIINYLLDTEYQPSGLRTGAEPSPAYFNIVMHGREEEVLDGTQLAADWTFSGLQKFGEGMLDRLKGLKLPHTLLDKINIVEIPGILEIRKQVQRLFPFNDACQWFIDRADIIFLVYDPSKLDVGPETEAILDQLKGREYQTRIILNKADQVKPEELMRVQGALIWNISPLMSSAEPPIMYSTSLWSLPYEAGAPTRLLYAQERALLGDLRSAIEKRVEHKIASARRFAVRVRNHAKMVDCYLTTYYNQKTFFGNKKEISDRIIENPQDYHIYEGLSTLTNISRYDLPDPDVYRDFFRLNGLYNFPSLSSTCTYFRGCPINRLDVAIAYDLPELIGKYKKLIETSVNLEEPSNQPPTS